MLRSMKGTSAATSAPTSAVTAAATALLALAGPALADGPNYNYLEVRYQGMELDGAGFDVDGDGLGLSGSFEIGDMWQVFANYNNNGFDFDVDLDEIQLGGGFHAPLTNNVDFVANFAWVRFEIDSPIGGVDDDGIGASIGLRGMVTDRFELAGFVNYIDLDDGGDDTSVGGQAWYSFTENFALGFQASASDDITRYGIGARLYFGR